MSRGIRNREAQGYGDRKHDRNFGKYVKTQVLNFPELFKIEEFVHRTPLKDRSKGKFTHDFKFCLKIPVTLR